jgi:hypothetical protein
MNLLSLFQNAFDWRKRPANVLPKGILVEWAIDDVIYGDAYYFKDHNWKDITADEIYIYSDVVTGTNPEAFCYFLPGILYAVYRENRIDCNAIDSLIYGLENSRALHEIRPFSYERWSLLNTEELSAVKEWLCCYRQINGIGLEDYNSSCETIDWLNSRKSEK